jgi:sugar lactone lactonase YvrE/uncharacterized protein YcgI (DUF1989 family)
MDAKIKILIKIKGKIFINWMIILILVFLVSCKAGKSYENLDTSNTDAASKAPVVVKIISFSPTATTNLASTANTTFGIQLEDVDSTVKYKFLLDDSLILQDSATSYYNLDVTTIGSGPHTLKVTASNAISSESHTFNLVKNSPPVFLSSTPALAGTSLACGADSSNFTAIYSDINSSDTIQIKWYMDGTLIPPISTTVTTTNDPANNNATINFHPNCTQNGLHFIRLTLNDGHEISDQTWTVNVIAPTVIHIADSTPLTDPTVLTSVSNATFAVSLTTPDQTVNYLFLLDGATPLQNNHKAYLNILGSTLTAGNHTLTVTASNSTSNDSKVFNIRKNNPPVITGYYPALTGTDINCGSTPLTLSADLSDINGDSLTMTWSLDDAVSPYLVNSNTPTHALVNFTPNCSNTGTKNIKLTVTDGYEMTTQTWSVNVIAPTVIHIASSSPTDAPTILTEANNATFTVTLATSDSSANYLFQLDGATTLQNNHNSFLNILGTSISAGIHTLSVTASNSNSNDTKIFSIKKNSAPVIGTFTPALTGTEINCGTTPLVLNADVTDANNDPMAITWTIDNASSSYLTPANTANKAIVSFIPNCSLAGTRVIKVSINDGYETTTQSWLVTVKSPISVLISSFTPVTSPTIILANNITTFGVNLITSDANTTYNFSLKNLSTSVVSIVQSGTGQFYNLSSSTLDPGLYELTVTVSNGTSSDNHVFSIRKNTPPIFVSSIPVLSGTNLKCGAENSSFTSVYSEVDAGDSIQIKWYMDGIQISPISTTISTTNDPSNSIATINYHPDCSSNGVHLIRLDLNDGHEISTQTWTVNVIAPITIHISDSTPATDPTVLTSLNNATFALSLTNPDQSANYLFLLDGATPLQNNHKAYLNILGSTLSAGAHTLTVTASNATSSDTKIFNIRKNSPPQVTGFSPALSGTEVNCGTTPVALNADVIDPNGDTLSMSWTVDDMLSSYLTQANTATKAVASFTPNCSLAGTKIIKVTINDGYETTVVSWSITIKSPIPVVISSYTPTTNPTILLANSITTFGVALTSSDSNITYNFSLKNLTTLAVSTLQTGTVPFYNLTSSTIAAGPYELTVTASNGTSSAQHVFSIRKNSPPSAPPFPQTFSPPLTGTILNCGGSSQVFNLPIADADSDIMLVTWKLDNTAGASNLISTSTQSVARATYSPTCAEVGTKTISVDIFDNFETTTQTWTVTVINPTVVSITAYSPNTDPISVLSTGAQTFTVAATGKAPLAYVWKLDGSLLSSSTDAYTTIAASSLTTGAHTLTVKVSDSDSNQLKIFNIIKNAPPVMSNINPANLTPKVNINTVINFSSNYADANNDTMTVKWLLNNTVVVSGNTNASLATTATTTSLTFTPSAARIGDNTIELQVSDGKEMTSQVWTLNVNYFSDICNNLGAGKACTIIGSPGRGSNINPILNPTAVKLRPQFITQYGLTSSYFLSDDLTHTVWFYNKSASTVNILGQSIGPGILKAVAGVGMAGIGTTGTSWNDFPLNNPRGLAWDGTNGRLFIADETNNRVVMLDSAGTVTVILANSGSNVALNNNNGTNALTGTWCVLPRGLAYDSIGSKLYVACASSSTVKVIDTSSATPSSWTASILSGYNASTAGVIVAGSADGTNGYAGTNQFQNPLGLKLDPSNNILYVTDSGHCKVKAINLTTTARTNYFFGAITLPASSAVTVSGINSLATTACTTYATGAYTAARYAGGWMQVELKMNSTTMQGLFITDNSTHRVAFINNTASGITLGNTLVPSFNSGTIWNTGGASYYMPCTSASSATCYLNNPSGMLAVGSTLYLADYSNYRIRTLDLAVSNGAVADDLGFDKKPGYAGNGGTSTENVQFNQPQNLYYDTASGKLLISDFANYRIRALNLNTGRIDSFISNGNGNANNSQVDPTVLGMQGPRNLVNYQNFIIFGDNQSQNCLYRAWNTLTSTQTIFGISTFSNAVQTIAGNWANGCGAAATAATGTNAAAKLNNPQGVTTDGTNLYFANTNSHCIIKLDQNGNMTTLAGLCGTSGAANGSGLAYSNSGIRFYYPTAVVVDPRAPYTTAGNMFILDQTANATATKIRYINQYSMAVTIYGVTINPGEIKTVYTAPDAHGADLATIDNQICISSGGDFNYVSNATTNTANHNVICFSRDDSTGTAYTRFGRNPSVYVAHGYQQENSEEEGIAATSISLAGPAGLAFDTNGNLYITERDGHDIRMVRKWW